MDVCRICLSVDASKDISQLDLLNQGVRRNYVDIMMFCLDIQVTDDANTTKKLCLKCFKKVVSFHKFKTLALKNDAYLRSLDPGVNIKHEVYVTDDLKSDEGSVYEDTVEESNLSLKREPEDDEVKPCYESEDELLSVIKSIKDEDEHIEDAKENAPIKNEIFVKKKKRGRPKSLEVKSKNAFVVCEECGKSVRNIKEHSLRHIPLHERRKYKCSVCDQLFSTYGSRYKHYRVKHLGIKKHCDVCNKDVVNLALHHRIVHQKETLPFGCVLCDRRFITLSALESHTSIHTKDRPHECDVCQKKFRTKVVLSSHIRQVHEKEKSHLCQFCSKGFFKKSHLQNHLRSHTKERPYKCPDCGKFYASSTILRNHRLIHSDVKTFECTLCDSTFVRAGYLRTHMLCHTKEKRHPCKYCGTKFGRSDHKRRHEYTAHEKHLLPDAAYPRRHRHQVPDKKTTEF